jgi:crotonobetainyl-CoA:carnitine CoA-transferase CaiB-like acyl-CoA transferase
LKLEKINPRIIMTSITPFGQTGPYKDYKAPDIVAWAMGGQIVPWGNADRPPVRISHVPQACLHAAVQAGIGAMLALYYRQMTGEGQQVDVSIQETVAWLTYRVLPNWDEVKVDELKMKISRAFNLPLIGADDKEYSTYWTASIPVTFEVKDLKDGEVIFTMERNIIYTRYFT